MFEDLEIPLWEGGYIDAGEDIRGGGDWPPRRVGLAWAGDPKHDNDAHRSMGLAEMLRLTEIDGIEFVSLQVGDRGTKEIDGLGAHALVRDMSAEIVDMRDTVRIVDGLDLVIAVDTAVVHLAGAMGVPCWLLANAMGKDWRWGRRDAGTPWYPSIRIYTRALDEQWKAVVLRVLSDLTNALNMELPDAA